MISVLHYIFGLNVGGAESFIYNLICSIPREECKFDFCIQSQENENEKLIEKIKYLGSEIFIITSYTKNLLKNSRDFMNVIKNKKYDIVHFHFNALINILPVLLCEKQGIKVVVHSHNTKSNGGKIIDCIHKVNKIWLSHKNIGRFSCGEEAGEWLFGKKKFNIVTNGIVIKDYRFNSIKRKEIRDKYSIDDSGFVVGNVGRFTYQKNHAFILKVFEILMKLNANSYLLLIGDGELKSAIEEETKKKGFDKNVIFTGNINNVNDFLSAMDIMLFPSHFEGLPFALIEAQASGLPIVASNTISKQVMITDLVVFESLDEGAEKWGSIIAEIINKDNICRERYAKELSGSDYDSKKMADKVMVFYDRIIKGVTQ